MQLSSVIGDQEWTETDNQWLESESSAVRVGKGGYSVVGPGYEIVTCVHTQCNNAHSKGGVILGALLGENVEVLR